MRQFGEAPGSPKDWGLLARRTNHGIGGLGHLVPPQPTGSIRRTGG